MTVASYGIGASDLSHSSPVGSWTLPWGPFLLLMSSHQPQYEDRGEGQAKERTGTDVGAEKVLVCTRCTEPRGKDGVRGLVSMELY